MGTRADGCRVQGKEANHMFNIDHDAIRESARKRNNLMARCQQIGMVATWRELHDRGDAIEQSVSECERELGMSPVLAHLNHSDRYDCWNADNTYTGTVWCDTDGCKWSTRFESQGDPTELLVSHCMDQHPGYWVLR